VFSEPGAGAQVRTERRPHRVRSSSSSTIGVSDRGAARSPAATAAAASYGRAGEPRISRYGERCRATEANAHFNGPLALKVPLACQFAVDPASTFATAATPSPTALPAESVNFTWIV
jgi:hypothetical protein